MLTEKKLTLNGSEWTFCYDWATQEKIEEETGLNVLSPQGTPSQNTSLVIYARLKKFHPEITLDMVRALIPGNLAKIADVMHEIGDLQEVDEVLAPGSENA